MKILTGVLIVIVLLVLGLFSLPFLIDLASYQEHYKPMIEEALNRKIELQGIRLSIWPRIGARIVGFTVMDDPSFSAAPFASLSSLDVGVKLWPLLSKRVEVEDITLRDPLITVIKNKAGVVNISTIGPRTPAPAGVPPSESPAQQDPLQALALLAVDRLSIDGGTVVYRDLSAASQTEYRVQDLGLLLKSVHLGETPTLHVEAIVQPHNVPLTIDGSFGPLVQALELKHYEFTLGLGKVILALQGALLGGTLDAVVTAPSIKAADLPVALPLTKPVEMNGLRIVAKAPYPFKRSGSALELADVTDLGLAVKMGKSLIDVKGTILGGHAKVMLTSPSVDTSDLPVETGFKKPVEMTNLEVNADLKGQEARVSNLSFLVFNGLAKAQGGMSFGSPAPPFNGKFTLQGIQVDQALDAAGAVSHASVSGTAAVDIALAGRGLSMADLTKTLEGPGHVEVKDGTIEGVNLMGEAIALLKIAGITIDQTKATAFSTIETDFVIKQGIANVQKLLVDSHDFQAAGRGTVGFDQKLNFALTMNLSQALSQRIGAASPVAKVALKDGRLSVPLLITGTVHNPSYALDAKSFTGKMHAQAQEKVKSTVEGLLQGTTKPADLKKEGEELLKGLLGR